MQATTRIGADANQRPCPCEEDRPVAVISADSYGNHYRSTWVDYSSPLLNEAVCVALDALASSPWRRAGRLLPGTARLHKLPRTWSWSSPWVWMRQATARSDALSSVKPPPERTTSGGGRSRRRYQHPRPRPACGRSCRWLERGIWTTSRSCRCRGPAAPRSPPPSTCWPFTGRYPAVRRPAATVERTGIRRFLLMVEGAGAAGYTVETSAPRLVTGASLTFEPPDR